MKVNIKKLHKDAVMPSYAHDTDAGLDLTAVSKEIDNYGNVVYGTGLAIEIPQGYVGLVFPRSSNSRKNLILTNSVGVIDSGYRGEIKFKYRVTTTRTKYTKWWRNILFLFKSPQETKLLMNKNTDYVYDVDNRYCYSVGDRIGQLIIIPYPKIELEEVEELSESDRGTGGYGSTGY
ncbi:dUTP diphosphatase [Parabacteroides chongii]|uniref:dUTP diphosphatase n=1 Tax=Parabacteroides chongii TaxID=2685834 RepID=UPI00240D068F|nr:dUTP diphosphatase [Parabacteroides chongii]WFE84936.1 dUTP diphosphatase [Parabacteroides chongii]